MKSLKRHLSLIIPLLAILFSLQAMLSILRIQDSYELTLRNSYSIIIAAGRELKSDEIALRISEFQSLEPIDAESIINKIQGEVSEENLERLKGSLPYYYSIMLSQFPNQARLVQITNVLKDIKDVKRVESFSKAHDRIYRLLLILKGTIMLFGTILGIVSVLLMIKQVEIWYFEHSERIEIMMLLGAPSWLRNGLLFRLAMMDSVVATLIVSLGSLYLSMQTFLTSLLHEIGVSDSIFMPEFDFIMLLLCALLIANLSVFIVIARITKERKNA